MTSNIDHLPLHPAAEVFRNHLLLEVGEENERLEGDISRYDASCSFLGKIELCLRSGRAIRASLNHVFVINNFNGLPCLCADVDPSPCHFSDFSGGYVTLSGQKIGSFPGVADPIIRVRDDDEVRIKIIFSSHAIVEGELRGLSDDDLLRFKDGTYGDERVMKYLTTGSGLPDTLLFIPETMFLVVVDELRETIRTLGPLPTFENENEVDPHKQLPVDPKDTIEYPPRSHSDEERLTVAAALDCAESEMIILEENRNLKRLRHRLSKVNERIDTVEIHNAVQDTRVSLRDGKLTEAADGALLWQVSLKTDGQMCPIVANNMPLLELAISGIHFDLCRMEIHVVAGGFERYFTVTFGNGAKVYGYLDPKESADLTEDDFEEMTRGFMSGERQFPPGFTLLAGYVCFPLHTVDGALNVLGIRPRIDA